MIKFSRNFYFIIPTPFLINFFFNVNNSKHLNLSSLFLSFLCFIFIYLLGKEISSIFNIDSISLAITYYFMGAFIINFVLLPVLGSFLNFKETIFAYNICLIFILLVKSKNYQNIFILLITLTVVRFILMNTDILNPSYIQYNSDVTEFWLPMTEKIYDSNLFSATKNNIIPGYSLMINFIYAELHFIFFSWDTFTFNQVIPNIFLYLNLLLMAELNLSNFAKTILVLTYLPIILNSDWLSYLFINSLMGEVVVNYVFSVFLVNAFQNKKNKDSKLYFFVLGFLYFLKPFSSFIFFIIPIYLFYKYKKTYIAYLPIFGFIVNNIYSRFLSLNIKNEDNFLSENFYLQILYENFNQLTNFNLTNIVLIFYDQIFIDRVLTLFLCMYLFIFIFNKGNYKNFNILNSAIVLNFFLVFYLYISIWKNIELGSAYRYLFSFLNIFFIDFAFKVNSQITK